MGPVGLRRGRGFAGKPRKILEQNIRDMTDQIPVMNENIVTVRANVTLAEKNLAKLREKENTLRGRIKAALTAGDRETALGYAESLEQTREDAAAAEGNVELAKASLEKGDESQRSLPRRTGT
ncbi:MAG: PspA/IM30 family protein [Deltaproteobacteria bacterium]|nr:PspA/IM30 family protein [Deltaproteobacteria bacterium]